jgi:hypothetical protein
MGGICQLTAFLMLDGKHLQITLIRRSAFGMVMERKTWKIREIRDF